MPRQKTKEYKRSEL